MPVQGVLCGDCLFMRYGENILEVDEKHEWTCPVCRGLCNCSNHRIRRGWLPTGTLYRRAIAEGECNSFFCVCYLANISLDERLCIQVCLLVYWTIRSRSNVVPHDCIRYIADNAVHFCSRLQVCGPLPSADSASIWCFYSGAVTEPRGLHHNYF